MGSAHVLSEIQGGVMGVAAIKGESRELDDVLVFGKSVTGFNGKSWQVT
jgi:hypothetical protein